MLWTIILVLLVLWVVGFAADVAGGLIHLLLLIAAVVFIAKLVAGRNVT